ncbi:MAG: hypothetical protein A4E57_01481 [Syntrophorhabdaceae bacterium PtaU1.Bin034]|nr:MAG: hypothetical protein A4E57_01481 [Syntrophorhabdaceae bacterium PtaU1.Bin034]
MRTIHVPLIISVVGGVILILSLSGPARAGTSSGTVRDAPAVRPALYYPTPYYGVMPEGQGAPPAFTSRSCPFRQKRVKKHYKRPKYPAIDKRSKHRR